MHAQGICGACWAFVASAATEAAVKIALLDSAQSAEKRTELLSHIDNTIPMLSAQELIDCDTSFNRGCSGGNPYLAMSFIIDQGLMSADSYPYRGQVKFSIILMTLFIKTKI